MREAAGAIACLAEVLPTPVFDSLVDLLAPEIIKGLPIAGETMPRTPSLNVDASHAARLQCE